MLSSKKVEVRDNLLLSGSFPNSLSCFQKENETIHLENSLANYPFNAKTLWNFCCSLHTQGSFEVQNQAKVFQNDLKVFKKKTKQPDAKTVDLHIFPVKNSALTNSPCRSGRFLFNPKKPFGVFQGAAADFLVPHSLDKRHPPCSVLHIRRLVFPASERLRC